MKTDIQSENSQFVQSATLRSLRSGWLTIAEFVQFAAPSSQRINMKMNKLHNTPSS